MPRGQSVRDRERERRARGDRCPVCYRPVSKLSLHCDRCDSRLQAYGDPRATEMVNIKDLLPYRRPVHHFLLANLTHPGITAAAAWIEKRLADAADHLGHRPLHRYSNARDKLAGYLARLNHNGAAVSQSLHHLPMPTTGHAVLAMAAALYYMREHEGAPYSQPYPPSGTFRSDAHFLSTLAHRTLSLARGRSGKLGGARGLKLVPRSLHLKATIPVGVRKLWAAELGAALGVLCLRIARQIEKNPLPTPVAGSMADFAPPPVAPSWGTGPRPWWAELPTRLPS